MKTKNTNNYYILAIKKNLDLGTIDITDQYFTAIADKKLCEYFADQDKDYDGKCYNTFSLKTKIKIYYLTNIMGMLNNFIK